MQEGAARKMAAAGAAQSVSSTTHVDSEVKKTQTQASPGLEFPRFFTLAGEDPFDQVEWDDA